MEAINRIDECDDRYRTLIELARNAIFRDGNGIYVRYKLSKHYIEKDESTKKIYFIAKNYIK